jgi:hypothetical protein
MNRRSSYLHEPRLQFIIDKDVISIALKTVLVVDHHALHGSKAVDNEQIHVPEQSADWMYEDTVINILHFWYEIRTALPITSFEPESRFDEESQVLHVPLSSVRRVVLVLIRTRRSKSMNYGT